MTRPLRWGVWAGVFLAVGALGYANRASLVQATHLLTTADVAWLVPAVVAIGLVYACRAVVYGIPLQLLEYRFPYVFLWEIAVLSTSLHQLLPAGGATGYAFLTYALHQRGASTGQASLIALIDTLSYAVAAATLVVASLVALGLGGSLRFSAMAIAFAPGIALVALAGWVYTLQRDRARLVPLVARTGRRLAALVHARWPDARVRQFLEEYYRGKATIARHPRRFWAMVAMQYLAVACDAIALYLAFVCLGLWPKVSTVFMGFVVSMAAGAIVSAPAGGGSFEVAMSAFFVEQGIEKSEAIAAAVLYRLVAFWIPVLVSGALLLRFRRRRQELRRAPAKRGNRA